MSKMCQTCGGRCCRYFCFQIDEPDSFDEFEDVRWYLLHEGVSVHVDEGDWFISIANRCKLLGADNRCGDYAGRPLICRKYDPKECDFTDNEYGYEQEFLKPEQLDAYARETLGEEVYLREQQRQRAKLDRARHCDPVGTGNTAKKPAKGK